MKPKTVRYPRDPSLDPQLVWKGKDEQDARPLEVPAVPIYIQEKSIRKEGMTREQIDAAIKKHAETETLYDQPYEDKGVVRVRAVHGGEPLAASDVADFGVRRS